MGSLTYGGEDLQEENPDITIINGHTGTVWLIGETFKLGVEAKGKDLADLNVGIIGARGAIGRTTTNLLVEMGVKNFVLHEINPKVAQGLERRKARLERKPNMKVTMSSSKENRKEAFDNVDIVISSASARAPFIEGESLAKRTIVIDDSQPPSMSREEAEKGEVALLWPIGNISHDVERDFNYGVLGEFGCAIETVLLASTNTEGINYTPNGRVDVDKIKRFDVIAKRFGITVAVPQSFGIPVSLDMVKGTQVK